MAKEFSQQDFEKLLAEFMRSQPDMVYLLNTSGLYVPKDTPIKDVQIKFLKAIKDSTQFRQSVADYMARSISENRLSFAGADESYLNDIGDILGVNKINPDYASGTASTAGTSSLTTSSGSTSSSGGTGFWGTVFSGQNISNILNTGLTAVSTSMTAKANKDTEQRALESQRLQIEALQAQQQLAATQGAAAAQKSKGMPGWGWALIGVGALAMITIVTVVIVKKGRARRAAKSA